MHEPSPCMCVHWVASVTSDSVQPTRLLWPWGFFRQEILEWVAMPSSRGYSQPRDQTHVSYVSCFGRWVHCSSNNQGPNLYNGTHGRMILSISYAWSLAGSNCWLSLLWKLEYTFATWHKLLCSIGCSECVALLAKRTTHVRWMRNAFHFFFWKAVHLGIKCGLCYLTNWLLMTSPLLSCNHNSSRSWLSYTCIWPAPSLDI